MTGAALVATRLVLDLLFWQRFFLSMPLEHDEDLKSHELFGKLLGEMIAEVKEEDLDVSCR